MKFSIDMPEFTKNLDMFGALPPNFNIRGQKTVKTSCGACVSFLILTIVLLFALLKMQHLIERKSPLITTNATPLEAGERFNLGDEDFTMAFAVTNYIDGTPKSDPRYINWIFRVDSDDGDTEWQTLHPCSEAELAKFHPPKNQVTAREVNALQAGSHLFCFDWQQHALEVYGQRNSGGEYAALTINLLPCASVEGQDDCVWEQNKVLDYLTPRWEMVVYHNQAKF